MKLFDFIQATILNAQAVIILSAFLLALMVMLLFLLLKNHKRNHRLLESVKREALNGYMMTDKREKIIAVTKAFLADTGYDLDVFKTSGQYAISDSFTPLKSLDKTSGHYPQNIRQYWSCHKNRVAAAIFDS